jgi:hypothetical protein
VDERREIVPAGGEHLDESKELEDLEVVDARLAIRAALRAELSVDVLEERRGRADRPAPAGHGLGGARVRVARSIERAAL